jgi:hypothetical protein
MADLTRILNLLESFRGKSQVQAFLQSKTVPSSGTWETVRDKIKEGLRQDKITEAELIQLLEDIEEYGDQYVYLYDFARRELPRLRNRADFERLLTRTEKDTTLDKLAVIENPSTEPTLVKASYQDNVVKLKWVQKRSYRKPLDESVSGNIATVRYEIISTRAVDLAILDLERQRATLCIQKIEPGVRDYRKELTLLFNRLARFADRSAFEESSPVDLGILMKRINEKNFTEVRRRRYRATDANGKLFDVTSATDTDDIFNGGLYDAGRASYTGALAGAYANVYWIVVQPHLTREIHTIFPYRQSKNAVVFTQRCLKQERDYVLSRIQAIARGES